MFVKPGLHHSNRFPCVFIDVYSFYIVAAGYNPDVISRTDISILRLSIEVPFRLKAAYKPCSDKCMKEKGKPSEFSISLGSSEVTGRLAIGLAKKSYELAALSWKFNGGAYEKRFVSSRKSVLDL